MSFDQAQMERLERLSERGLAAWRQQERAGEDRLHQPGGGGDNGPFTIVQVKQDGGDAGSLTTAATWTYSIWPQGADIADDEQRLAAEVKVLTRRPVGRTLEAMPGDLGLAFILDREWVLYHVSGERLSTSGCETGTGV